MNKKSPTRAPRRQRRSAKPDGIDALRASPSAPYQINPDKIESALLTGEHSDLLERYFGREGYAELRGLAQDASTRSVRGGPRVLILPGIMGSTLGSARSLIGNDTVWIDPVDIAAGNLTELALIPGPARHGALGVFLPAYLKLKLSLKLSGFDADFHEFDWRQNLDTLGRKLAERLKEEKAGEITLVAHSMGGLVSRAALSHGAGKVRRLIMLGTPNYGSFVPTQALRGVYPILRKIALVDLRHSPEELTTQVFNTFPGLYQMLPAPEKFSGFDLFSPHNWPKDGPQPRPPLLEIARKAQSLLAPPDKRFVLIAGVNQETVTDLRFENGKFLYTVTRDGDGTVPLAFAQLPSVTTYFIEEGHGSLPNNGTVAAAVRDLISAGSTTALPTQWTPTRAAAAILDDDKVRQKVPDAEDRPRGAAVSDAEVRCLIEELAAPTARAAAVTVAGEQTLTQELDRVVVGRRRQKRLDIKLALGSITEANSRAYVLGIFSDVTPSGAAKAIDTRMDGAIAEFTERRMFSANVGEVFIVPTGSHALRPDIVLFAGLGAFDRFNDDVIELVAENVIRTFVATGVDDFATVLIGGGSGRNAGQALQRLLQGFLRGLLDADKSHNFRRVTLCEMDPDQYGVIKKELYRLAATNLFSEIEVTFEEETLPQPPETAAPVRGLAAGGPAPAYLMVRQQQADGGPPEFQTSLLTAGGKATVVVSRNPFETQKLDQLLDGVGAHGMPFARVDKFGQDLAKLVFADDMAQLLASQRGQHLVVVHDAPTSRIPWETLRVGDWSPAADAGMSRRYMAENLSVAKWLEQRRENPTLSILLVVNPTEDLEGAEKEGDRVNALLSSHSSVRIVERRGKEANKPTLLKDFSSGQYDVIHYAGHAFFDPAHRSQSGVICAGGQPLSGVDLAGLSRLPSLIFFNACQSGQIRNAKPIKKPTPKERLDENAGMAEAFLRGGAANYVGTFWPVGDSAAEAFAGVFYTELMRRKPLGAAVLAGRQAVLKLRSQDWADYILYGSPEFVLKTKGEQPTP
jgi:pimeloyl-ACP methyl ester carboxylesterase